MSRPTGITILGILYLIAGIFLIIAAVAIGVISASMGSYSMMGIFSALGAFLAVIFGVIAIVELVIAGALFSGKWWGRTIVIILSIIDLILNAVSLFGGNAFGIALIILDIIVLYYMWRPHVITYFKGYSHSNFMCVYCGHLAETERELHNHHLACEKKQRRDSLSGN